MSKRAILEKAFANLSSVSWSITSKSTRKYNCLAWAVGETHRRWDTCKGAYWPESVPQRQGIAYLVAAYRTVGFEVCNETDGKTPDPQYDKIVLYELNTNGEHAAKLLDTGHWSSKLGDDVDIEHATPEALSGPIYGQPLVYMKRLRSTTSTP